MNTADENHARSIRKLQKQIEKLTMDLEGLEEQQNEKIDVMCDKIDELEAKLNDLEMELRASKNGKLIWKISRVTQAMKRAVSGEELALFSDVIYTGSYGYKLRAILYPNGIASGQGTHMSLYVTIEKGEYDALLNWPFKQRVFLSLLDQNSSSTNKLHRTEELLGDRNSTSFHRPKTDTNPGWGFPKFILLDKLKSGTFIKDDCMFVKIEVESFSAED
eukprot:gene8037-8899_t